MRPRHKAAENGAGEGNEAGPAGPGFNEAAA